MFCVNCAIEYPFYWNYCRQCGAALQVHVTKPTAMLGGTERGELGAPSLVARLITTALTKKLPSQAPIKLHDVESVLRYFPSRITTRCANQLTKSEAINGGAVQRSPHGFWLGQADTRPQFESMDCQNGSGHFNNLNSYSKLPVSGFPRISSKPEVVTAPPPDASTARGARFQTRQVSQASSLALPAQGGASREFSLGEMRALERRQLANYQINKQLGSNFSRNVVDNQLQDQLASTLVSQLANRLTANTKANLASNFVTNFKPDLPFDDRLVEDEGNVVPTIAKAAALSPPFRRCPRATARLHLKRATTGLARGILTPSAKHTSPINWRTKLIEWLLRYK